MKQQSQVIYASRPNGVNASNGVNGSKQHMRIGKVSEL
jgi:hypothetical protein